MSDYFEPIVDRRAQAAINQAEETRREMVAAWQAKEEKYRRLIRELAYHLTIGLPFSTNPETYLKTYAWYGLDDDLIAEVLAEHENRRQKDKMRCEQP